MELVKSERLDYLTNACVNVVPQSTIAQHIHPVGIGGDVFIVMTQHHLLDFIEELLRYATILNKRDGISDEINGFLYILRIAGILVLQYPSRFVSQQLSRCCDTVGQLVLLTQDGIEYNLHHMPKDYH